MTQNCQMKVTSSDGGGGGTLSGLRRVPKASTRWTFLVFSFLWTTHYCSVAAGAAVATETLMNTEPITTSISLTEEATPTTLTANDSAVQTNSSSSATSASALQPANQQLSLYAIDGDTLDRLFAQYISNVLYSKQLLHTTDGSNFGGLVDIRKDQQLQQVVGGSSSISPNEKAVILLKGSHSQLVINGNLVQYIYHVDNAKCNLVQKHHISTNSAQTEKPEVSLAPSEEKKAKAPPLAVIKSISQHFPVANLSSHQDPFTTTVVPIAAASAESSSFITTQFTTSKSRISESSSFSSISSSPSTSNISTTRTSIHLTTKRPFTKFPNSVTENLSLAQSTTTSDSSRYIRRSSTLKQSVSTSAVWPSITFTTRTTTSSSTTIRPRVSIVGTPMSTTRSSTLSTLALTATTAQQQQQQQHQHDSLISIKSTSTAKTSFTGNSNSSSTTISRSRSRSTARPSFTTTTTTSITAPLTDQLTTMSSPSNGKESSSAPPFTLTFGPSPSSSSVAMANTRLSPSSSPFSSPSLTSPTPASMFPTLSVLTTSSLKSAALPSKSPLISKGPQIFTSSSTTTAPNRSTKSGSSSSSIRTTLSTAASNHSLNSSGNSDKVNLISLTTVRSTAAAVNDLSANLGSSNSTSADSSSNSSGMNSTTVNLSTTVSASKQIVLSISNKTTSTVLPFTTSTTLPPPSATSESILDNTIDVDVDNSSSSTPSSSTARNWSTEKSKQITEKVMDQSDDKLQPVRSISAVTSNASTTTTTTTAKTDSLKTNTHLQAVKNSSTRRPSPGQSSSSKTKVTRFPSPIVSWHRNQSSTPSSTLSVKQALKTTTRLRPPQSTKKQSSTTTRFVPTRFIYPMAPTSPTSLASSTRARLPFEELNELRRRFIENKRNFFNRILATTTTRRPVVLFPSFAKWIQGNFRQGRR